MANRITPGQIRKTNRQQIYDVIYRNSKVSQQDITYELRLSRPTVATSLSEMEEIGLIFRNGQLESDQIGRKAVAYSIVADYRIAIGVEVMRRVVKLIAVDLYGKKIDRVVHELSFAQTEDYFQAVCERIQAFILDNGFSREQILGVGIAVQGLVTEDGKEVIYGKILDCTGLSITSFTQWLEYPCTFIHDSDAAAITEIWYSPDLLDAFYLSLSRHLGGSMITDRQIKVGRHGRNATFEHMQAVPGGELCYCGKRGCQETLLSVKSLLGDIEPEVFFEAVRKRRTPEEKAWKDYLVHLAGLIENLSLVNDTDFILGGHLAPFLTEDDIDFLYGQLQEMTPFPLSNDFLFLSKMPSHNITIGAALLYIRPFLKEMDVLA